jgi:ammonia channel protein AmtB
MQLWNYENKQKQVDLWRKYQLGLLGIPSVAGYTQPTEGMIPGLVEGAAAIMAAKAGKKG